MGFDGVVQTCNVSFCICSYPAMTGKSIKKSSFYPETKKLTDLILFVFSDDIVRDLFVLGLE